MKKTGVFLIMLAILTSCVPHKKLVYFQGDGKLQKTLKEWNDEPYRLQVDDILYIDVRSTDEKLSQLFNRRNSQANLSQAREETFYFTGYSVDKDGNIDFPFTGKINVLGYTPEEVSGLIRHRLSKYFKNTDDVYISTRLAGIRYTVIGEVHSTGSKVLYQNKVTLVEALADAGDITLTGDRTRVEIIRSENNEIKKYTVDLTDMDVFESEVFYIRPHDIIYVPALKQKSYGTGATGSQTLTTVISVISLITTSFLLYKNL